ncbi:hypothetical protein GJA_1733 [Janthinobacterium agaricidamnosum NBRC 102515 = DSM 9628]|uniref:Uncharacterized protein n=1 Tax=Janthinobacterium agaricidamnosum NBRC 102515 = DSM 9628 TaxID=1349767 RepID=W0V0L1_9BURK|nr:hypothetical protein GJA_1733 [Janthinobacterium agaricidamnosum NBRC 102515 = DSM 9628]
MLFQAPSICALNKAPPGSSYQHTALSERPQRTHRNQSEPP